MRGTTISMISVLIATTSVAMATTDTPRSFTETTLTPYFDAKLNCLNKKFSKAKDVTHYVVPLLKKFNERVCNTLEGTCIYEKNNEEWLHNYGYQDQRLRDARCKNGYGNMQNCLHPCRVVAASMSHHRFGQILFIEDLVGQKCGNRDRDGFEMIHDGYVVVMDTGSPSHFNSTGRFDFFWGRCRDYKSGVCNEGAREISKATSNKSYCVVWDPRKPLVNEDTLVSFSHNVRREAARRGDHEAASDFDLTKTIGRKFAEEARASQLGGK